ncbi:multiple epidermal growth factor-like domains protein 6-like [Elysia marginata]|uniref:Multiple epidermal growth factor-like domains protein 6-like n=1 Tax=Elysia marginata TaxID=1093978 RepID=A0AAV4JJR2_9GAST|nr:multiple epidermal growth factor-like domains protein 6-like [Elysia marginata]
MPINSRKVEISNNFKNLSRPFSTDGSCVVLLPRNNTSRSVVTLYIDLLTYYPVHRVILRGHVISHARASISVRLDDTSFKNISFRNDAVFSHDPAPTGRVLTLSTAAKIKVCSIQIYTCKAGTTGKNCEHECAAGFYGLSCKMQCKCMDATPCDKVSGVCPPGTLSVYPVVKAADLDKFCDTRTVVNFIAQGPTKDLISAKLHKPSEHCFTMTSQCASKSLYLELDLAKQIPLYGVEMIITKFYLPAPFSIYITSDGQPCFGFTSQNNSFELGKHVFKCQRQNLTGKYILARFSTYNKTAAMNTTGVGINVCNFKALECLPGFYGRHCRQICSCAHNDCDKVTGKCSRRSCGINSRGPSCSSIDVFPYAVIVRKKHHDSRSTSSESYAQQHKFLAAHIDSSYSWLALELDGVYTVNSFTLTLPTVSDDAHRAIQVFTDSSLSIDKLSVENFHDWPGLPCTLRNPEKGAIAHHLACPGLVRTIFIVVISDSIFLDVSSAGIKVSSKA